MTSGSHLTIGILGRLLRDNMNQGTLLMVLGIRPDIIRASIIIRELRLRLGSRFKLVWSGQHYSDNLKDIFFRELGIDQPDIELGIKGNTDAELVASMILELSKVLAKENPTAVIFLGDTNTVTGTIAAGQLNIPIVHIEGCMRSYDWRMPEEKYRSIADHLSDVIYAYLDQYKLQGIAEGIPADNIVVSGNPIVDVIQEFFLSDKLRMSPSEMQIMLQDKYRVSAEKFLLMTCHRRENVESEVALENIMKLAGSSQKRVIFLAGYRTQRMIKQLNIKIPRNVLVADPVGYLEFLELLVLSEGVLTDSGTVVEEASILGVPSIQMRMSTERPQVYSCGASVKFDPFTSDNYMELLQKIDDLRLTKWQQPFGDGKASYRIVDDLLSRLSTSGFQMHQPEKFLPFSAHSYSSPH